MECHFVGFLWSFWIYKSLEASSFFLITPLVTVLESTGLMDALPKALVS